MRELGFLADFIYRMWLIERPIDLPGDHESQVGLKQSYWDVVFRQTTQDGVQLSGRRQGLFQFNFPDGHPGHVAPASPSRAGLPLDTVQVHVSYANCFALCYHSAFQSIDNVDIGYFLVQARDIFLTIDSPYSSIQGPLHRLAGHTEASLPVGLTKSSVLDAAFASFNIFHEHGITVVQLGALLNQAAYSLQWHNVHICLTIAWTVSEVLLGKMWSNSMGRRVDKAAAVMTRDLVAADLIPHTLGEKLDEVRKARNAWVHAVDEPSIDVARLAVSTARDLMLYALGITIELEKAGSAHVFGGHYW